MRNRERVLVIAPHADDETLAMGGTIARKVDEGDDVQIAIMTGPGETEHPLWPKSTWEQIRGEARDAAAELGSPTLRFGNLPAACLDHHPAYLTNKAVEEVIRDFSPTQLFLPHYHDLHKDHGAVCYAGIVASRGYLPTATSTIALVAMYETPTETDLLPSSLQPRFSPTMYVDISDHLDAKLRAWSRYASQQQPKPLPRHPDSLRALARLRGSEVGAEYAEAFQVIRHTTRYQV